MTPDRFVNGVECHACIVALPLPVSALEDLADRERGALWFHDVSVEDGATFITAWFQEDTVFISFHGEAHRPSSMRQFALVPMHYSFVRPHDVALVPLTGLAVRTGTGVVFLSLYEAIDAVRTESIN